MSTFRLPEICCRGRARSFLRPLRWRLVLLWRRRLTASSLNPLSPGPRFIRVCSLCRRRDWLPHSRGRAGCTLLTFGSL